MGLLEGYCFCVLNILVWTDTPTARTHRSFVPLPQSLHNNVGWFVSTDLSTYSSVSHISTLFTYYQHNSTAFQNSHWNQALTGPKDSRRQIARHSTREGGKTVSPAAFISQKIFLALISVRGRDGPRIKSVKNSNDRIGNWTHDLPTYNTVPQPTTPRRAPFNP
jgi:hypothetical protein